MQLTLLPHGRQSVFNIVTAWLCCVAYTVSYERAAAACTLVSLWCEACLAMLFQLYVQEV